MKRPTGLTVIGVVTVAAAVVLGLGCLASFLIAAMGITEGLSGDAASNAIIGMAMGGGFSLLILAMAAAGLADGVFKMRKWAWSVSIAWIGAGFGFTVISLVAFRRNVLLPVGPSVLFHLLVAATAGWMLTYLLKPRVKRVFGALGAQNFRSQEATNVWIRDIGDAADYLLDRLVGTKSVGRFRSKTHTS